MEILDDPFVDTKKIVGKICWSVFLGVVTLLIIDAIRPFIPSMKFSDNEIEISFIGLLIFGVLLGITNLITNYLNQINSDSNELRIAAYAGTIIFIMEFLFKTTQHFIYFPIGYDFYLLKFIRGGLIVGVICFLFSNYRIRKIRGMDTSKSLWLFFGFWIGFGMLKLKSI